VGAQRNLMQRDADVAAGEGIDVPMRDYRVDVCLERTPFCDSTCMPPKHMITVARPLASRVNLRDALPSEDTVCGATPTDAVIARTRYVTLMLIAMTHLLMVIAITCKPTTQYAAPLGTCSHCILNVPGQAETVKDMGRAMAGTGQLWNASDTMVAVAAANAHWKNH
jgi:hypothetical protein